jgi:hypothetical protein
MRGFMASFIQHHIDFHALLQAPGEFVEGAVWTGWWGLSAYFAGDALWNLHHTVTQEASSDQKWAKTVLAVKTVFVDLLSLGSASTYLLRWANSAKVIALGAYSTLVNKLCFGTAAVMYGTEACWDVYQISLETDAISKAGTEAEKEPHRQRLGLALLKLSSDVTMIAWAVLSVASIAGIAVSSVAIGVFLFVGTILGVAAMGYKYHLDERDKPLPEGVRA